MGMAPTYKHSSCSIYNAPAGPIVLHSHTLSITAFGTFLLTFYNPPRMKGEAEIHPGLDTSPSHHATACLC